MKTSILLSSVVAIAVFFGIFHPTDGRAGEREGYSIEVKVTPIDGEARVTKVTGIALEVDRSVDLPLTLSHTETPATVGLSFDLSSGTVSVNIQDLEFTSKKNGTVVHQRDFYEAELFFEFAKEKTICATVAETISLTVTAPAPEKAEDAEAKKSSRANLHGAPDVSKLEVEFRQTDDRVYAYVYNPTEQTMTRVVIRVTAAAAGDFKGFDRRYLGSISLGPLAEDNMQIEARLPALPDGVDYEFSLESAR